MIKDINIIKKELINYIEITDVYDLTINDNIKYITLKDNSESFYLGGKYIKMGENKIFIYNAGNTWGVPIQIKDNNCNIIYNTRFFVEDKQHSNEEIDKLKLIIKKQKILINKLMNK